MQESITCPVCGKTSYNPNDIMEGYCGNCHKFTSGETATIQDTLIESWFHRVENEEPTNSTESAFKRWVTKEHSKIRKGKHRE